MTTVVAAYFPMAKSKHSPAEYLSWLENLLSFCESPMVIFTSNDYRSALTELRYRRGPLPTHFVVDYASPLEMPPIKRLKTTFEEQLSMDPERNYHTVELYAIWSAKSFMLNYSAHINHFRSDFFLYVDAGSFRSKEYRFTKWPGRLPIQLITESRLLLSMVAPLPRRFCPLNHSFGVTYSPITFDLIEGGIIGGSSAAVHWWTTVFYDTIDRYRSRKIFIGKDQHIMNAIALAYANRVLMLLPFRASWWCGNEWFAYGPLLAHSMLQPSEFVRRCQIRQSLTDVITQFDKVCSDSNNID
ncbi:unnamed protein product [Adineta steineri]|uniref:Uncharacterized protein n=1 Tax=Adineta steineri TaxID=433720 RepID=A0A819U0F6_9BILA|nr:unnamed protein product [Adineta steineri]CAF4089590.1 unnamed protein product [Adineta steineri]